MLARIETDQGYQRLVESTLLYPDCWKSTSGFPLISNWSLAEDSPHLLGGDAMAVNR